MHYLDFCIEYLIVLNTLVPDELASIFHFFSLVLEIRVTICGSITLCLCEGWNHHDDFTILGTFLSLCMLSISSFGLILLLSVGHFMNFSLLLSTQLVGWHTKIMIQVW